MQSGNSAATRLKVLVEADPGSLVRVLQFFQARNVIPLRFAAHRLGAEYLQIDIDVADNELSADTLRVIAGKIGELPVALCAVICDGAVRGHA